MSEQETPIELQKNAAPAQTVSADAASDTALTTTQDAIDTTEQAPNSIPAEDRVFGVPRPCFHGAALGIALGYMLTGVIGYFTNKMPNAMLLIIVCGGIGYFLAKRRYTKKKTMAEQQSK